MFAAVSSLSITSDSSDYALPPDDDVSIQADSSGDSEPEQKLLKYTADSLRKVSSGSCFVWLLVFSNSKTACPQVAMYGNYHMLSLEVTPPRTQHCL